MNLSKLPYLDMKKGVLEDSPLPFLLGAVKLWELTGVLTIERNKARKQVFFLEGLPVYCKSDLGGESLRQVMYKAGKIDHQTLAKVENHMKREHVEEDRALLELGILDENTRYFHLQEQARKRILSTFAWATGRYKFEATENFLDRIELFDIDPLEVIHDGIATHHVLDIAGIMQQAAAEHITPADNIEDFKPFIERFYPGANTAWANGGEQLLGNVLAQLHPDIAKSLNLAFILLATGGMLIGGKRPGELEQPPPMASVGGEPADETEAEAIFDIDPWTGDVESPSLDDGDEDLAEIIPEPSPLSAVPPSAPAAEPAAKSPPSRPRKPPPLPAEPPWKRRQRMARQKKPAPTAAPSKSVDSELENRYKKMLEVVRTGDHYKVLDVTIETPRAEIKKAFFYRYNQFDPHKASAIGPDGERLIKLIHEGLRNAYDVLLDPARRYEYEMRLFADEKQKAWSIKLRTKLAEKQWLRGKWYLSQRHPELALGFFDSAVNLDTEQAPYYAYLGWAQYASRKGDVDASISFIRTALGINSKLPEAYLFMGWIYKDIGNEKKANECFALTLNYDPSNSFAKQELQRTGHLAGKKHDGTGLLGRLFKK